MLKAISKLDYEPDFSERAKQVQTENSNLKRG